jgi:hypothetical protein
MLAEKMQPVIVKGEAAKDIMKDINSNTFSEQQMSKYVAALKRKEQVRSFMNNNELQYR